MHAGGGLLGNALDVFGDGGIEAGLGSEALLDRRKQDFFFFAGRVIEEAGIAAFRPYAEMDQQGGIAAVVEDHVGRSPIAIIIWPFEDLMGVFPIVGQAFALDRKHRRAVRSDRGGGMVLSREYIA